MVVVVVVVVVAAIVVMLVALQEFVWVLESFLRQDERRYYSLRYFQQWKGISEVTMWHEDMRGPSPITMVGSIEDL